MGLVAAESVERVADHDIDASRSEQFSQFRHAGPLEDVLAGVDISEDADHLVAVIGGVGAACLFLRLKGRAFGSCLVVDTRR